MQMDKLLVGDLVDNLDDLMVVQLVVHWVYTLVVEKVVWMVAQKEMKKVDQMADLLVGRLDHDSQLMMVFVSALELVSILRNSLRKLMSMKHKSEELF